MAQQPFTRCRDYPARPQQVYLMGTCLVDSFDPQAGMDAIQFLQHHGVEVLFPQQQSCCGQPAFNSGFDDEARQVARQQLKAFAADIPVVVMMGSCAAMLHCDYARLFEGQPEEAQAKALAARTFEFTEFVDRVLCLPPLPASGERVVLHTSCSARRSMGVAECHQRVLQNSGVEVVEPNRVTECCGFGGTFALKQGDISAAMACDKAEAVAACGVDTLVSADCGCLMNIGGTLAKQGRPIKTRHIASLLRQRQEESL
ncbi:Fe-S oxidoreductase [Bacterioplanes sanyensis]|uniref:(Fe-S)-binding protein n=1 Tax=Bacterioplanes sanyensis TaxID=1249553 RepID=UPI001674C21F|nr:(Fe-S)-binding protein [Bacterioplanes sanyensis]GGY42833.1 Fe-S oxidoreductase [Bacterioplanes sanyensis]